MILVMDTGDFVLRDFFSSFLFMQYEFRKDSLFSVYYGADCLRPPPYYLWWILLRCLLSPEFQIWSVWIILNQIYDFLRVFYFQFHSTILTQPTNIKRPLIVKALHVVLEAQVSLLKQASALVQVHLLIPSTVDQFEIGSVLSYHQEVGSEEFGV